MENQSKLVTYLMLAISFIIASSAVININAQGNVSQSASPLADFAIFLFIIGLGILVYVLFKILDITKLVESVCGKRS